MACRTWALLSVATLDELRGSRQASSKGSPHAASSLRQAFSVSCTSSAYDTSMTNQARHAPVVHEAAVLVVVARERVEVVAVGVSVAEHRAVIREAHVHRVARHVHDLRMRQARLMKPTSMKLGGSLSMYRPCPRRATGFARGSAGPARKSNPAMCSSNSRSTTGKPWWSATQRSGAGGRSIHRPMHARMATEDPFEQRRCPARHADDEDRGWAGRNVTPGVPSGRSKYSIGRSNTSSSCAGSHGNLRAMIEFARASHAASRSPRSLEFRTGRIRRPRGLRCPAAPTQPSQEIDVVGRFGLLADAREGQRGARRGRKVTRTLHFGFRLVEAAVELQLQRRGNSGNRRCRNQAVRADPSSTALRGEGRCPGRCGRWRSASGHC